MRKYCADLVKRRVGHVLVVLIVILAGGLLFSGCDNSSQRPEEKQAFDIQRSSLNRDTTPDISSADFNNHIRDNHDYTFAIYNQIRSQPEWVGENLLISPLSMRTAFSQAYGGARNQTATELASTLRYSLGQSGTHAATNQLALALETRNDPGEIELGLLPIEVRTINSFWSREGEVFQTDYLDLLALNYGAGIYTLDFTSQPDISRLVINDWVAKQTYDRIQDLLPEGSISPSTVAVLTNAVYFKAPWQTVFDPELTGPGQFNLTGGGQTEAEMMTATDIFYYTEGEGYQALEMPFRRDELGMVFILPDSAGLDDCESELRTGYLSGITEMLESSVVEVRIPKFSFESEFTMKKHLQQMGMIVPFTAAADFTGVLEQGGIFIDEAYHKTFIAVDETGAEAAAATAIVFRETGIPVVEHEFTADRPFLFFIRDRITGAILFMGRVTDPS